MNVQFKSGRLNERRSPSCLPFLQQPTTPDRIVTLAGLSARLPDGFIAQHLARALRVETGESVLLIQFAATEDAEKSLLLRWGERLPENKGEFAFNSTAQRIDDDLASVTLLIRGELAEVDNLASVISHVRCHFQYVILQVNSAMPVALLMAAMFQADRTFLLLRPDGESFYHRELLLREIQARPSSDAANIKTVVCRDKGEDHCNALLKEMGHSIHGFVHDCPSDTATNIHQWPERHFHADVRRLAREVARCRVGLALSSGGARGLAHIGVIQVLEENGVEVDVIAGCSMGSYVGAVWAYGYDGYVMEKLAREVEKRWGLFELIDPFILPRQGFLRGEKVKRRLKRSIGDVHFSELVRPLRIVATSLATLERAVFSRGEVACAVHASSAIPGACIPVRIEDELYLDGGIADPLPVDVLQELGIEKIIAVNTIPTAAYLRCRYDLDREQAARRHGRTHRIRTIINQYLNYFAPGNILDIILRAFHGAQMRVAEMACLHADVVLRPLSFDGRWHDFRNPGKYIALGRREAEENLDAVKALVSRREPVYELQPAVQTLGTIA
jgi:NTE family protein